MYKITDNNGALMISGTKADCIAWAKAQLKIQYDCFSLLKKESGDWWFIKRIEA